MLNTFFQFWSIGCFLSFITLVFCSIIAKKKDQINQFSLFLGIFLSWLVVVYFIILMIRGYRSKKDTKSFKEGPKISDSEMIKTTIDEYWVPATKYGKEFDSDPYLPIHNSPLCEKYYHEKPSDRLYCKNCPIHKAGFGCTAVGFFLKYQKSNPEDTKRAAMILGKLFSDIYKEVLNKERYNREFR